MSNSVRIKRKKQHKFTKAEARRLSGGKYWIMGLETKEALLIQLGVELGPKQVDKVGRVKRARGMVVWGQCTISDMKALKPYWRKTFFWGPDCPDHIMKDRVQARRAPQLQPDGSIKQVPHHIAEVDWMDEEFRKTVGADEIHS